MLLQALYNTLGSTFVAGCSVAGKVSGIANIAITSYSSAATVFAGQNLGARNYRRLCRGAWQIPLCSGIVTLAGGLLVTAFCHPLLMLFSRDPAVLAFAQRYTYLVLPFTWAYAVFNGIMCFINGIGEIRYPTKYSAIMGCPNPCRLSHHVCRLWRICHGQCFRQLYYRHDCHALLL